MRFLDWSVLSQSMSEESNSSADVKPDSDNNWIKMLTLCARFSGERLSKGSG